VDHQALLQVVGNGVLIWMALVGTASVVVHLRVFDRRSAMSRHLLVYMTAIALVLDLGIVKLGTGDSWGFQLLRLVAFAAVGAAMTQRLWLQIKAQRETRTNEPPSRKGLT
jgi:hypothetical protein